MNGDYAEYIETEVVPRVEQWMLQGSSRPGELFPGPAV